jgi:hypothetical protein
MWYAFVFKIVCPGWFTIVFCESSPVGAHVWSNEPSFFLTLDMIAWFRDDEARCCTGSQDLDVKAAPYSRIRMLFSNDRIIADNDLANVVVYAC